MKLSIIIFITSSIVAFVCFISCTKESPNPVNRVFDVTGFNKIIAGDDHEIIITRELPFPYRQREMPLTWMI